ncbi:S8 family peptidase [Alkaliphilus peptidifermentans]|uniref:Serine protease AprX n=1 Tax=Alkaliphilus peptidifermentans DSM 18978 TaxID=1120976 RepID=A0A1G5HEK6_9FIRM|nr:S8 family peptidase [Alkaliphilus peptidifermentans]SCY61740.1 serine protease AprX [Alkaliphilus peptidifermentans DSM 18978]
MFGYSNIIEDLVAERLMVMNTDEEELPVIISAKDCECDDLEAFVIKMGGKVKHKLHLINAVAAYMPSVGVRSVARDRFVEKIQLDDKAYKLMDIATVTVGSDYANEYGLTGKDVTVAVIDTGIYPHSDLVRPTNRIIGFKDFVGNKKNPYDDDGHGTHVAGIIGGNGFASRGKYMGIAPDANLVGVKVLDHEGGGSISDVIAGIQWVIENKNKYNIKVITLSLGTKAKSPYHEDPLCKAVDAAVRSGITVVGAAGNNGPEKSTINSPAISPNIISVGACDDRSGSNPSSITIADFSSRGPTPDGIMKPDIIAPGVKINSLGTENNNYVSLSGTSMAAPVVAGCSALIYESNPSYSPAQVKALVTNSAESLGYPHQEQGAGLLDIRKILSTTNPNPIPRKPDNSTPKVDNSYKDLYTGFHSWYFVIFIVFLVLIL